MIALSRGLPELLLVMVTEVVNRVLGVVPNGRNNALSVPFFNHSAIYSDYIAFIVPRSWRKWSVVNRLDASFHLVVDDDLSISFVDSSGASA